MTGSSRLRGARPAIRVALPVARPDDLAPLRQPHGECSVGIDDERSAVEHELVLPAHLVHVEQREPGLLDARGRQLDALLELFSLERRSVGHDQHVRAAARQVRGHGRVPHVLANHEAEADAPKLDRLGQRPRGEDAFFVEDAVVGQIVLVADGGNPPIREEHGGVVDGAGAVLLPRRRDEHGGTGFRVERERIDRAPRLRQHGWTQHEVLGRVSDQRELAAHQQVAAFAARDTRFTDPRQIAGDVTNRGIDLCEIRCEANQPSGPGAMRTRVVCRPA